MNAVSICIIKLGALGDVVRTTPIIEALKHKFPNSKITWITKKESLEILEDNPNIEKIETLPIKNEEKFDILYNFDIDEEATKLALQIKADKKYGYYDNEGFPASFNESAEYYINTYFDDDLKTSNRKTYQEMIFDSAELPYHKQKIKLYLKEEDKEFGEDFLRLNNIKKGKVIGINIGSSKRWPSKSWDISKIKEFTERVLDLGYHPIILGGKGEEEDIEKLKSHFKSREGIYYADTKSSLKKFFSIIHACDVILCADTLALHVALAFDKKVIGLFFCTSPYEIEGYNQLVKIVSPLLSQFFPEKMDQYDKELKNSISVEEVLKALNELEKA